MEAARKAHGKIVTLTAQGSDEAMTSPDPEINISLEFDPARDMPTVISAVLRGNGGRADYDDVIRQTEVVCGWIREKQIEVALIEAILRGRFDLSIDSAGEIIFTPSARALRKVRPI